MSYTGALDPGQQIDAEKYVASVFFDYGVDEEQAGDLGHLILHEILSRFRPDLIAVELPEVVEGCLFPDSHCPGHDPGLRFGVLLGGAWYEATEAEIIKFMNETGQVSFTHSSQWDFWCEDIHDHGGNDD